MKKTDFIEKMEEQGINPQLQGVITDISDNILRITTDERGAEILQAEGYILHREEDSLLVLIASDEQREGFIDSELQNLNSAYCAGAGSVEMIARLISIVGSLQESLKLYREELTAVENQI